MIDKTLSSKHSKNNSPFVERVCLVLFGFVKDLASHLDRRCARKRKCRGRQDAESDPSSIHSNGYASSDDQPTCLASSPTKSKSFMQYAG